MGIRAPWSLIKFGQFKNEQIKGWKDKFVFPPRPYYFSSRLWTAQESARVSWSRCPFIQVSTALGVRNGNDCTLTVKIRALVSPRFISPTLFTLLNKCSWFNPFPNLTLDSTFWYLTASGLKPHFFLLYTVLFWGKRGGGQKPECSFLNSGGVLTMQDPFEYQILTLTLLCSHHNRPQTVSF